MKKNQEPTTTKFTSLIGITKRLLGSKRKGSIKPNEELVTHEGITIIGELMWEKETQEEMTWFEAMEYAKNLRLGGYDDWRLPSSEELLEVVTLCGGTAITLNDDNWIEISDENAINKNYHTNCYEKGFVSGNDYWSSTNNTYYSDLVIDLACSVNFNRGYQSDNNKTNIYHVRCVRAGE